MAATTSTRMATIANVFIDATCERMCSQTQEAMECLTSASWLGVRQNLTSLRDEAERAARIERHLLHRASSAQRLQEQVGVAVAALDGESTLRLEKALTRIMELVKGHLGRRRAHPTRAGGRTRHSRS